MTNFNIFLKIFSIETLINLLPNINQCHSLNVYTKPMLLNLYYVWRENLQFHNMKCHKMTKWLNLSNIFGFPKLRGAHFPNLGAQNSCFWRGDSGISRMPDWPVGFAPCRNHHLIIVDTIADVTLAHVI